MTEDNSVQHHKYSNTEKSDEESESNSLSRLQTVNYISSELAPKNSREEDKKNEVEHHEKRSKNSKGRL